MKETEILKMTGSINPSKYSVESITNRLHNRQGRFPGPEDRLCDL